MQLSPSLFETLFKKNTDLLSRVATAHPYFSPAQFFLLQQSTTDATGYKKQAAKTAILFNNPYWLNFQLLQAAAPIAVMKEEVPGDAPDNTDNNDDESLMEKEIEPMKLELKIPEQQNNAAAETPLFEPMHLVDYFASQGIKLTEEAQTADKLGKQLKSFTEWLKTMKKVHSTESPAVIQPGEQTDAAIQILAEKSNKEDEVLTESMADVFAKQGKTAKAMEVYEKLSLLNPSKNAYFAAKIEQLKGV
jgi:hypothetical protein